MQAGRQALNTLKVADELRGRYPEFGEMPELIIDFMDVNRR